jgi:nucleoside-diphosphate-sugar epimerase
LNIPLTQLAGATLWELNAAVLGGGVESLPDGEDGPDSLQAEADAVGESWRASGAGATSTFTRGAGGDTTVMVAQDRGQNNGATTTAIHGSSGWGGSKCESGAGVIGCDSGAVGGKVLLTGGTGFVGAFLLHELMQRTPNMHVVCMVRATTDKAAAARVQSTLAHYCLQCDPTRWSAIAGDLEQPFFGLDAPPHTNTHALTTKAVTTNAFSITASSNCWKELVATVNAVYHVGAIVNAALPLAAIRAANIAGTKTVVEFCVSANAALHHISTASVLAGSNITAETFHVPPPRKQATAYAKSKWVAEQIVGHGVMQLGLRARIYRLGTMSAHSLFGDRFETCTCSCSRSVFKSHNVTRVEASRRVIQ